MESNRKFWNKRQTEFRRILLSFDQHGEALELFLSQHAALHSAKIAQSEAWSFEDEIFEGMTEEQVRQIPQNWEHSVAWLVWHIARIEDVAMNLLVAGEAQILNRENWLKRMKIDVRDTGNAMHEKGVVNLSAKIDIAALRAYRLAVGRETREMVKQLPMETLKRNVEPSRLQQVRDEGAVVEAASGLLEYWSRRNVAGLLLMPATRHNFIHLNEAMRVKRRSC